MRNKLLLLICFRFAPTYHNAKRYVKTMYRTILLLIFILVTGCAHRQLVELEDYDSGIVGEWKERTKSPTVLDIRGDGTFTEHHPYAGGCITFEPNHGKWKVEGNLLKLAYGDNIDDSVGSAVLYQIEELWDKGVIFRYPNPKYIRKYKRVK